MIATEFLEEMTIAQLKTVAKQRGLSVNDVKPFGHFRKRESWLKMLQAAPEPQPRKVTTSPVSKQRGLTRLPVIKTITYCYAKQ